MSLNWFVWTSSVAKLLCPKTLRTVGSTVFRRMLTAGVNRPRLINETAIKCLLGAGTDYSSLRRILTQTVSYRANYGRPLP